MNPARLEEIRGIATRYVENDGGTSDLGEALADILAHVAALEEEIATRERLARVHSELRRSGVGEETDRMFEEHLG